MTRLETLEANVHKLYATKNPERDEWADWLGSEHVPAVADYATDLAEKVGANAELARAAALLHDIADATMSRFSDAHEETSLQIAKRMLQEAGYGEDEIKIVADDAIRYHSCHDGAVPQTIEGKVLATADSMAHLLTDFYVHFIWAKGDKELAEVKELMLKKLERDFHAKILFDDARERCRGDYEHLKQLFSR